MLRVVGASTLKVAGPVSVPPRVRFPVSVLAPVTARVPATVALPAIVTVPAWSTLNFETLFTCRSTSVPVYAPVFTKKAVPAVPRVTLIALPVVSAVASMLRSCPASWLLLRLARLPVEEEAPRAETLKTLPVKLWARTFTAPVV